MADESAATDTPDLQFVTTHQLVAELAVRHHALVIAGVTKIRPDECRFECFGGTIAALGLVEQFAFSIKCGRIACGQLPPQSPRPREDSQG
jgi:hypothetical protein